MTTEVFMDERVLLDYGAFATWFKKTYGRNFNVYKDAGWMGGLADPRFAYQQAPAYQVWVEQGQPGLVSLEEARASITKPTVEAKVTPYAEAAVGATSERQAFAQWLEAKQQAGKEWTPPDLPPDVPPPAPPSLGGVGKPKEGAKTGSYIEKDWGGTGLDAIVNWLDGVPHFESWVPERRSNIDLPVKVRWALENLENTRRQTGVEKPNVTWQPISGSYKGGEIGKGATVFTPETTMIENVVRKKLENAPETLTDDDFMALEEMTVNIGKSKEQMVGARERTTRLAQQAGYDENVFRRGLSSLIGRL